MSMRSRSMGYAFLGSDGWTTPLRQIWRGTEVYRIDAHTIENEKCTTPCAYNTVRAMAMKLSMLLDASMLHGSSLEGTLRHKGTSKHW